jgi:Kef-type K+ transport system membrane component KefB
MNKSDLILVLLEIGVIVGFARLVGVIAQRCGQPAVVGEILAGIMLGPSLFGALAPGAFAALFPPHLEPQLFLLSQLGLIFFMFLVGLGLDHDELRAHVGLSAVISGVSIVIPLLFGVVLAVKLLYGVNDLPGVPITAFALFIGAAMSITAFAVLARIIRDLGVGERLPRVAALAIATASIDDLAAWCLLAVAVALTKAHELISVLPTIGGIMFFAVVMATAGRSALELLVRRFPPEGGDTRTLFTIIYVLVTFSALFTEWIGTDVIFGGFIIGAVMPKGLKSVSTFKQETENFISTFLLPIFFAYSGLNTRISLLNTPTLWLVCLAVILTAIGGKFLGVYVTARLGGVERREAGVLGWLMNTRGMTELIILNIALSLKVISPTVFTIFVVMALTTTMMTSPLVAALIRHPEFDRKT